MGHRNVDYGWIVFLILIVIVVIAYKPVMNAISKTRAGSASAELVAKGRDIFYDPDVWGQKNRSCAMCHAKDYILSDGYEAVEMKDYRYVELKNLKKTYEFGVMGNPEQLMDQVSRCLSSGTRIEAGTLTRADPRWEPLLAYLVTL